MHNRENGYEKAHAYGTWPSSAPTTWKTHNTHDGRARGTRESIQIISERLVPKVGTGYGTGTASRMECSPQIFTPSKGHNGALRHSPGPDTSYIVNTRKTPIRTMTKELVTILKNTALVTILTDKAVVRFVTDTEITSVTTVTSLHAKESQPYEDEAPSYMPLAQYVSYYASTRSRATIYGTRDDSQNKG